MPGIGVVTNPLSRRNRRNPRLMDRLAYILGDEGDLARPRSIPGMEEVARRFRERDIDILCINGGDGTGHVVLSAMARVYGSRPLPLIALLRGGTMNTVAHGLGIKGSTSAILDRVLTRYQKGLPFDTRTRNLLCVDGHHYGFLFGNGAFSNFLEVYYEGSEPSPTKAAVLVARLGGTTLVRGRLLRRLLRPVRAEVLVDGQPVDRTHFVSVAAATVDDLGLGFKPFWAAPANPDRLHYLGIACDPLSIIRSMHRIYAGRPTGIPDIDDRVVRSIRIAANVPQNFMVDGDFHRGGQVVEVTVGPRVRLVV